VTGRQTTETRKKRAYPGALFLSVRIHLVIATELKTGRIFQEDGVPFQVLKYEHIKSARGGANVKVKARNLLTGNVFEKGYDATAQVEDADVTRSTLQYLYHTGNNYVFMKPDTFEQLQVSEKIVGESAALLQDGEKVTAMYFNSNPIAIELPKTVVFEVSYTEPGFKGNTVTNVYKDAELTNGTKIKVPTFVKIGDKIKINTDTGEYSSKA